MGYFLLNAVSRVVDSEKQLPLGRAELTLLCSELQRLPWEISSGWVEALGFDGFCIFTSSTLPWNTWA